MSSMASRVEAVGQGGHTVRAGECVISIAKAYGHFWETIWNHPENSELKRVRGNPMILLPGDRLTIPKIRLKEENCPTDASHRFETKGSRVKVRVRFLLQGKPLANQAYRIMFDGGAPQNGKLDGDGLLDHSAPPHARSADVWIGSGTDEIHYTLRLGELDPLENASGLLGRLMNLGYLASLKINDETIVKDAVKQFQIDHRLDPTGEIDDATRNKLVEVHGS